MNLYNYFIGQFRFFLYNINLKFIRLHIREQVGWRQSACYPYCQFESKCCGCKTPNVFFAPKSCSLGNYPKLMNKKEWKSYVEEYKYKLNLLDSLKVKGEDFNNHIFHVSKLSYEDIELLIQNTFGIKKIEETNSDDDTESVVLEVDNIEDYVGEERT